MKLTILLCWTCLVMQCMVQGSFLKRILTENEIVLSRRKRWEFATYAVTEEQDGPKQISRLHSSFDNYTGNVIYSIDGEGANSIFKIDQKTGQLTAQYKLDREAKSSYKLTVHANDLNGNQVEESSEILVNVQDINDNVPIFSAGKQYATVKERSPRGTVVTDIIATDADDINQPYGQIQYSLLSSPGDANSKFAIHHDSGVIKTATSDLDRETTPVYELIIQARDAPNQRLGNSATTTLTISVVDVNDNAPRFIDRPYQPVVNEDLVIGSEIMKIMTEDEDLRDNARTKYSIVQGRDSSKFYIETRNHQGILRVKEKLDYETSENHEYKIQVRAYNTHIDVDYLGEMDNFADVVIRVMDVNEPPEFNQDSYQFSVLEDAPVGFPIKAVSAFDPEGDSFLYFLEDPSKKFQIDPKSGMISVIGQLDRETKDFYDLIVKAGAPDFEELLSSVSVKMSVIDVNDNPAIPLDDKLETILCLNNKEKYQILKPDINMKDIDDPKQTENTFKYFLFKDEQNRQHFRLIDNQDGSASLQALHNEFSSFSQKKYDVQIVVQDSGVPPINATYTVTVLACQCTENGHPLCDAIPLAGGVKLEVLIVVAIVSFILLVLAITFILVRRRRSNHNEALIKGSISTCDYDEEIRENIIQYNEEGGGEEDTAAFDLSALQRDFGTLSSQSQTKSRLEFSTPNCYNQSQPLLGKRGRMNELNKDVHNFITDRKSTADQDDNNLAFDSLQIYAYEGSGSDAGSLSSLCTSSDDSDQEYDHLQEWGSRFTRLADIYGQGKGF